MNLTDAKSQESGQIVSSVGTALAPKRTVRYAHSYVKFRLGHQWALLPTHQVLEAITVPTASVTPMPNMPAAILGLINRRSQVLWVTDLTLLLGMPAAYLNSQQYNLVLLQIGHVLIGLQVQEIEGILSIPPDQICAAPANIPAGIAPFLQGCFLQNNDVVLVLNAEAVLRAPALQPR
ncbi:MAG: purine-binding chemotaxis protein CheW [Leptolyngbya sp. SIO1E4]|nr:purine-binding chemotaxis protein CheW [Leptolyngbya sp. SIO1E4]